LPVKNAHKILVLDQGKLAEEGSAEELMAKNGIYSRLVNTYNAQNENLANGERICKFC
jgi:ABC-type multidrug transport system fused ATPase/permease subunit